MTNSLSNNPNNETPVESWKEIASYLQRDVRTVTRWEKHEGLPVHRHHHLSRSSVYAYPGELDAWRARRQPVPETAPLWRRPLPSAALALVLLLALASVGSGPYIGTTVQAADGSGITLRQVWAGPGVDVLGSPSPDGRYLSFVDWDTGDLAVRDLTTGKNRHLTNKGTWWDSDEFAEFSVFSPDSKQIAYNWYNKEESFDLRIIGLDGSPARVIARCSKQDYPYAAGWSPDGKRILVEFDRNWRGGGPRMVELAFVSVADGKVRTVKSLPWPKGGSSSGPRLSPDARHIAFVRRQDENAEQSDIFLLSADGSQESALVRHRADDRFPVWTPDGKKILFASDRTGAMAFWAIEVADGKPRGLPQLVKPDIVQFNRAIGFSRDGSFYYSVNTGMEDVYIAELDPSTGKLQSEPKRAPDRFVGSNMGPAWSPDGRYLAYHSQHGPKLFAPGALTIVIRNIETGEERDVSTSLTQCGPVRWFPHAQSVLVPAYRDDSREPVDYYRVDLRTGEASLVRPGGAGQDSVRPDLSPDGRTIFFTQTKRDDANKLVRNSVMSYDIETGKEKEILVLDKKQWVSSVVVSPDGKQLAFVRRDIDTARSVQVIPVGGGQTRELLRTKQPEWLRSVGGVGWSHDGRYLFVVKDSDQPGSQSQVLRVPLEGGEAQEVGLSMQEIRTLEMHPDNRRLAFRAGRNKTMASEIWVMEDFLPGP